MANQTRKKRKLSLSSVFFTFFVDNLSWSIVFPIFAPYFLDVDNKIFSPSVSDATRTTILGFFLAIFPLGQFFGAPIMGDYGDKVGRKKVLLITIFFSIIGLALSAISIHHKWLTILFLSRLISGVFSGNLSICLAAITDMSPKEKSRVKHFGYLAVIAGFSFILGAFLGGKFSDATVSKLFSPALPFWIATSLSMCNFLFIYFFFNETKEEHTYVAFDFLESIHNVQRGFRLQNLKFMFLIYFLFLISWNILLQFTPVLVIDLFQFTNSEIGNMAAFMGICWAIGAGIFGKLLIKKFQSLKVLEFSLLAFTLSCGLIIFPKSELMLLFLLGLCVIIIGIAWPLCTNLISQRAPSNMQGNVLGISQSMQSLAMTLSPLVGVFTHFFMEIPFLIGALSSFIASLIYFLVKK